MEIGSVNRVFLLGIGGIGMSALARYFNSQNIPVSGYDKTPSPLTDKLQEEGIQVFFTDSVVKFKSHVPEYTNTLFIYTPAVPSSNDIYRYVLDQGIEWKKRAQVLGIISREFFTIAVAGTHGKTTTSSIVSHLLNEMNLNFTAFLGGISSNFNSNYFHKTDGENSEYGEIMVVEADEFDRSFLHLSPNVSILTSMDADHLDIYSDPGNLEDSFIEFLGKTDPDGVKIVREGLKVWGQENVVYYGPDSEVKFDYSLVSNPFQFDIKFKGVTLKGVECGLPGFHNAENSVAALAAVWDLITDKELLKKALWTFSGVKRRFEILHRSSEYCLIDDYAHHPTELNKFISSVKKMFPDKKVTGLFQPHLFSRTNDFYREFAASLDMLDVCYLLPIYPARELPMAGVSSELILSYMTIEQKNVIEKEEVLELMSENTPELLLIMGAGDIDRLTIPLKELYDDKKG
jgi:UDP-N-acetylmuramate--alanine ligase